MSNHPIKQADIEALAKKEAAKAAKAASGRTSQDSPDTSAEDRKRIDALEARIKKLEAAHEARIKELEDTLKAMSTPAGKPPEKAT